jgi:hypothetical protein
MLSFSDWRKREASGLSALNLRVEPLQLDPGVTGGKAPVSSLLEFISVVSPGLGLLAEGVKIRNAPILKLTCERAELNLGNIETTRVFRRICISKRLASLRTSSGSNTT